MGVELSTEEVDGKKWAGIFLTIEKRPKLKSEFLFAHCPFTVKNRDGHVVINEDTRIRDMYKLGRKYCGWGIPQFIERDEDTETLMEETDTLIILVTFKLYFPSMSVLADLAGFKKPATLTHIKIMSSDNKSFAMTKEIISARSPVFEPMLKSNMTEGKEGIIRIPDMGSKSLRVLLNYICDGGLTPDWRESEVVLELTNAAAKYQLPELLNFLDGVAGKVCDEDNAGALMMLVDRLSLKQAERDLLSFVRIKGTSSIDSFIKILKSVSPKGEESSSGAGVEANTIEDEKND